MASRADVNRLVASNRDVVALVESTLGDLWASLDMSKPETARDALVREVPVLVAQFGDVAATVAADWYDDLRADAGVAGRFSATLASNTPAEQVESQVRFGAQHLFASDPNQSLAFLLAVVGKYALKPGRDTITRSAQRDPAKPRWARVPSSRSPCAFCRLLASRGAVYGSKASAGDMHVYHGRCHCVPTPIWTPGDFPKGYDPGALHDEYLAARSEAETGSISDVLAALRQ